MADGRNSPRVRSPSKPYKTRRYHTARTSLTWAAWRVPWITTLHRFCLACSGGEEEEEDMLLSTERAKTAEVVGRGRAGRDESRPYLARRIFSPITGTRKHDQHQRVQRVRRPSQSKHFHATGLSREVGPPSAWPSRCTPPRPPPSAESIARQRIGLPFAAAAGQLPNYGTPTAQRYFSARVFEGVRMGACHSRSEYLPRASRER